MKLKQKINWELRMEAFDFLMVLKDQGYSAAYCVGEVESKFDISRYSALTWYRNMCVPHGRKGKIQFCAELFYVLGALLGDGCTYKYKPTQNQVILSGDELFTRKYAEKLSVCNGKHVKNYINRRRGHWFVLTNNFELYNLFKKVRENISYLGELIDAFGNPAAFQFIEGFFDAEGCVKIIKEPIRITPKICLDLTNTNFKYLELIRLLLQDEVGITAKYSAQPERVGKDGFVRKKTYHLRIYKKEHIRRFFEYMSTTKLKPEKIVFVKNWLNNGL